MTSVNVSFMQNGRFYTDSVLIRYHFSASGDDTRRGTPDFLRASDQLEAALLDPSTVDPASDPPIVDDVPLSQQAAGILRDWWMIDANDPAETGSVIHWLRQVQSPEQGGAHAIDTVWHDSATERDKPYRDALDAAIQNWGQWLSVAAQLGLSETLVLTQTQLQQAGQLITAALRHAIDRVHARCQARANDFIEIRDLLPSNTDQQNDRLARLIIEADPALEYHAQLRDLALFAGIDSGVLVDFDDLLGQLCYQVEIDADESGLSGNAARARVNVKTGIRVAGVSELLVPPPQSPLVVNVQPVGNTRMEGVGLGRTDVSGVYDRTFVSAGPGDGPLAVDASVVFSFNNLTDPEAKHRAETLTYATRRLTLDPTPRGKITSAPERLGDGELSDRPQTLVNGETAIIEVTAQQGRTPLIGKFVNVVMLGEGRLVGLSNVTDASGRMRFKFQPPGGNFGRTRIAYAYTHNGTTVTDSITLDYTTSRDGVTTPRTIYSQANTIATTEAGLHLAQVGLSTVLGSETEIDDSLLTTIQQTWLDSGMNPDGTIDTNEPCGVRCAIKLASESAVELKPEQTRLAILEHLRWEQTTRALNLDGVIDNAAARDALDDLIEAAIDDAVDTALARQSAELAQAAMQVAAEAESAGRVNASDAIHSTAAVLERLGYEIRVDEARVHGDATSAWVQVVTRVYLRDPTNPSGPKLRAARDTPMTVKVVPEGFRIKHAVEEIDNGLFAAKAYIIDGDTDLKLIVSVSDQFARSETTTVEAAGKFTLGAGARELGDDDASLTSELTLYAGQQARVEGIVQKGLGRVAFRNVLAHIEGAPPDSITRVPEQTDAYLFMPPQGQTGTATITMTLLAGDELRQETVTIHFSGQAAPEGEHVATHTADQSGNGLLNNEHTVAAFNEVSVPLAVDDDDAKLGNTFGLSFYQFPFSGGLPTAGQFRSDVSDFFSDSFELLHIADMQTILGLLSGLPAEPEDLVRIKFDLDNSLNQLSHATLAADFSGLLPNGFEGSLRLDRPELGGQIVFGLDTSSSPFYVLTQPDRLTTKQPSLTDFLNGGSQRAVRAGAEATELTAKFGVAATFNSNEDFIDGILSVPRAEGYLSSKLEVDFSDVATDTGKLRFDNLGELANLKVGFDGSPIDSFQAIASAEVTLPNLGDINSNNNPLANLQVIGAIQKGVRSLLSDPTDTNPETKRPDPFLFQLRTGDGFELDGDILDRLGTATVETDDRYEPNDTFDQVQPDGAANLGMLSDRITLGGQDPGVSDDLLALSDAADWFRFETIDVGNASSFARVDFDPTRGDLDLSLYRLEGTELVHVRSDGLAFGSQAQITLLGQPAGTYFAKVFDDGGGLSPFYALTIDPPGRLDPGVEVTIGDFRLVDTALEINVDTNLEFSGFLGGRMVMTFGHQNSVPVELGFRAQIDTIASNPDDNGGISAEITTGVGGESLVTLNLRDASGESIVPPSRGSFVTSIDSNVGGYVIFDYVSADDFKFAGLDAQNDRWVMGHRDPEAGWVVPVAQDWRSAASRTMDPKVTVRLVFNGRAVELWVEEQLLSQRLVISQIFSDNLEGKLGLGSPDGEAKFTGLRLASGTQVTPSPGPPKAPVFNTTVFADTFSGGARDWWQIQSGIWRVENGDYVARGTSIDLGEWLLVDRADLTAFLNVEFDDTNILATPSLIEAGIHLFNVNALLFRVDPNEDGTRLDPDDEHSPKGLVAIRDGFIEIGPNGVSLGADGVSAGLQDVLFIDILGAEINLTDDPNEPLLATRDIKLRVPELSETENFVTISGADSAQRLFGVSKPTAAEPIPELLLYQDSVTIDFAVGQIQDKIDVGGVFPLSIENVGLRFNDAGSTGGQIGNLADFDLLVTGQLDFTNDFFVDWPFQPIFAVGQPIMTDPTGVRRRLSGVDAYSDMCTDPITANDGFPGFTGTEGLCQNGYLSAELHLGALVGDHPELFLRNLGPLYIGFQNLALFGNDDQVDGGLTLHGLIELGGFDEGKFVPKVDGTLSVTGTGTAGDPAEGTPLGSLRVAGEFFQPRQIAGEATIGVDDDVFESKLTLDWYGEASGQLGDRYNISVQDAAINIHTEFTNTFSAADPYDIEILIEPRQLDSGDFCVNLGPYVDICGSGVLTPSAGDNEPIAVVRSGTLRFNEALGPLAGLSISAGGFGIGRDGTVYVIPSGYQLGTAEFPRGAFVEFATEDPDGSSRDPDQPSGSMFGLPGWFPVEVRKVGLQFNGLVDPQDPDSTPLRIDSSIFTDPDATTQVAQALTDPENFTLLISGGLQGNEVIPLTGDFENLRVNLGSLAGCIAVASQGVGVDLTQSKFLGHIFDSECAFPIEGLDGVVIGVEPIDFGPVTIGGTLGLGNFTFERPIDENDPSKGIEKRNVFYGIIEGELAAAKFGLGAEIIITQFGPVAGRLKVGVPIPIGTLVGALGGPVGAGLGTASGMLLNNLEGGFVFGAEPLPVIQEPTDIFTVPEFRAPLRTTVSEVRAKVEDLAFENPSFSEIVSAFTNVSTYTDILTGLFTGDLSSSSLPPMKFTWNDGFRAVISGTLSNQYAAGVLGLAITAGMNVGFNFDSLVQDENGTPLLTERPNPLPADWPKHPNGEPAMDFDGVALDPEGNRLNEDGVPIDADPIDGAVNQTLSNFSQLFGFQIFGFADIDILGTKMAGVGALLDFTDPVNPVFNLAAALPADDGLLSLVLPFEGMIGIQVRTDGMVEGSILAALTFIDTFIDNSESFFGEVLTSVDTIPPDVQSPVEDFANRREADRRFHTNPDSLRDRNHPDYDERFDPEKTGYDPDPMRNRFADAELWQELLDVDGNGSVDGIENKPITRQFVIDRVLGRSGVPSILPDVSELETAETDLLSLAGITTVFVEEILVIAPVMLRDQDRRQELVDDLLIWESIETQIRSVHDLTLTLVDDRELRDDLNESFQLSLDSALLTATFSKALFDASLEAGAAAAQEFVKVINPSLRIVGQLGPAFLGIPLGQPSNQVEIFVSKEQFLFRGEFSVMAAIFNFIGSPAWVNDRTEVDVLFPFENLLADAINLRVPTIDPEAGDWRVGLATTFNVLGLEVSRASGLIFPAGAEALLLGDGTEDEPGKLQLYGPNTDPSEFTRDKILVNEALHYPRLLEHGGILVDGRLTLPRLITDPFALFEELQADEEFNALLATIFEDCDGDGVPYADDIDENIFSCVAANPFEAMKLLSRANDFVGIAATLEEVAQVQLFVPNVFNEGTTLQDAYLVGSYGQWPAPFQNEPFDDPDPTEPGEPQPFPTTPKLFGIDLGSGRLNGEVTENGGLDIDLVGNFLGLADMKFTLNTNDPAADTFDDTNGNGVFDMPEIIDPLSDRAPFGVYNAAEIWFDANQNGHVDPGEYEDLDENERFDAVGDGFLDLNFNGLYDAGENFTDVNGNGVYDPPAMRVGGEFILGAPPPGCNLTHAAPDSPGSVNIGTTVSKFLAHMGLGSNDPSDQSVDDAFSWIGLDDLSPSAGLCLRAFSPGFDPDSEDPLMRQGGIRAAAALEFDDFFRGDVAFQITPSQSFFLPNVVIEANASSILTPGLEGLSAVSDNPLLDDEEPLFSGSIGASLSHIDGVLGGHLSGSISLLGTEFTIPEPPAPQGGEGEQLPANGLTFFDDGMTGSVSLSSGGVLEFGAFRAGGAFSLEFDTRPSNPFGAIMVTGGVLSFPGFSLVNASFEIRVDSTGLRISNINADMSLLGSVQVSFNGEISVTASEGLVIDLEASAVLNDGADPPQPITIGPGDIQGSVTFDVDSNRAPIAPIVMGTFSGTGTVFGVGPGTVASTFNSDGCIIITQPLDAHFELPGGSCGRAFEVGVVLKVAKDIPDVEGDPDSGDSDFHEIMLTVTAEVISGDAPIFVLDVPYEAITASPYLADTPDDFELPGNVNGFQTIRFTEKQLSQQIPIRIRRDTEFEADESFLIRLREEIIVATGATWHIDRGSATVTIQNDDDPNLSELDPPLSTLVHFDFDRPRDFAGRRLTPSVDEFSSQDLGGLAPLTTAFEPARMNFSVWPTLTIGPGLPAVIDEDDGRVSLADSNAAKDAVTLANSFFSFTVDPTDGGWLPQGIDFFAFGDDAAGLPKGWNLYWDRDGYRRPILSSNTPGATVSTELVAPDWAHHNVRRDPIISATDDPGVPMQRWMCLESPATFRLQQSVRDALPWRIDNVALTGKFYPGGCASSLDRSIDVIREFLNQQDLLLPGTFVLDDLGLDVGFGHDPGNTDPTRFDFLSLILTGTTESISSLRLLDSGAVPTDRLPRIHVTSDGGLEELNFDPTTTFRGAIEIGGPVGNEVMLGSLADGSSLMFDNQNGDPVTIDAIALGDEVFVSAAGDFGNIAVANAWLGGGLVAENASMVEVEGTLGADLMLQGGLDTLAVMGGDLIGTVMTGLGGQGGDVGQISVSSQNNQGGSMTGMIDIGGSVGSISSSGGSIMSEIQAGQIGSISSTMDVQTSQGGDIAGTIQAGSIDSMTSAGGAMTASVTTLNPDHAATVIASMPLAGVGGIIDSPNSFHFAGGIASIAANRINLRVVAGGRIERIVAVDDGPDRPAVLEGRFTAASFGRIETDENGTADFELTATDEAWQFDGEPAFETILVQPGSEVWLTDQIHLNTDVRPGVIRFHGEGVDTDGDGVTDAEEDAAPGNGDGNNDGTADSQQSDVVSLVSLDNGHYITLVTDLGSFAAVSSIQSATFPVTVADTLFESGLVDFRIQGLSVGGTTDVRWLLHSGEDVTGLFYRDPSAGQSEPLEVFAKDPTDGSGIELLSIGEVTATFREGGTADQDGEPDGVIHVTAGAGLADGVVVQNPIDPHDVNNDGIVSPRDALKVINVLARIQGGFGGISLASSDSFYDVNDDGQATPRDALNVINFLALQQATEAETFVKTSIRDHQRSTDAVMAGEISQILKRDQDKRLDSITNLLADQVSMLF
ncbi:MAG: hypothetical protein F9B45_31940 [Phycisphaera sp. RhM]|nr:hypothetical protein [Phycisphaera sp. RhM]